MNHLKGPAFGREREEGYLQPTKKTQTGRLKALDIYFADSGVPEEVREGLVRKFEIEVARVTRPKWVGRLERGGKLATLNAPLFLKRVYADYIDVDGSISTEIIRTIDPQLMRAVESYISKRRQNNADLGDAEGLIFVLTRPSKGTPGNAKNSKKIAP